MRAFIAIDLEPEIKENLQTLIRELLAARADIRWVNAGGMHVTLKFLGEIDEGQARRVQNVLAAVARRHRPFPLRLEGTGAFPDERRPRIVWVGLPAEPEFLALQDEIDRGLEAEGFERELRAFTPHLTLGRVKGPGRIGPVMAELDRHRKDAFGSMIVRRVALFESTLRPEGAHYRVVFEAGLS